MKGIFNISGFFAGMALTIFDFATSYLGFRLLLPPGQSGVISQFLPIVIAALALAFNARASRMVVMFKKQGETNFGLSLLLFCFLACILFDGASSWVGFMCIFANSESIVEAVESAVVLQFLVATVTATLVTIGPFVTNVFHELIQEEGGFMKCLTGLFQ